MRSRGPRPNVIGAKPRLRGTNESRPAWGNVLYLCTGYVGDKVNPNKPVYALRPGGAGNLALKDGERQNPFIAWMEPNAAPYNPGSSEPYLGEILGRFRPFQIQGFQGVADRAGDDIVPVPIAIRRHHVPRRMPG